jgi:hypothetical protein
MLNPGAVALAKYLRKVKQDSNLFARIHGIDRVNLKKVLDGRGGRRVSVDFAWMIQVATKGEIEIDQWISPRLRKSRARSAQAAAA